MANQSARLIEAEEVGDVTVVAVVERRILSEQNIQMIGGDLFRFVDELGRRKVLLDFGNVEFMSSAVLGKLITLYRKLQAVQGALALCRIAHDILELFMITRLNRFFTIVTDPALTSTDAIIDAAFGNPFRATAFSAAWQTDTVLAIARQMDAVQEFSGMPILADALQDAGCDNEELLARCREPLTPVRGRWLLAVVLQKG